MDWIVSTVKTKFANCVLRQELLLEGSSKLPPSSSLIVPLGKRLNPPMRWAGAPVGVPMGDLEALEGSLGRQTTVSTIWTRVEELFCVSHGA